MSRQASKTANDSSTRPEGPAPIQLYSMGTPNGHKISIALEEMGVQYDSHMVHIMQNTQFTQWFQQINPNSKIPALVDKQGLDGKPVTVWESGAILLYLAEKTGKFLPSDPVKKYEVIEWLMWQMGGFGPMLGQMGHFHKYAKEDVPYGKKRYEDESKRLFQVLEKQLDGKEFVCGELSIADFAIYPWAKGVATFYGKLDDMGEIPNVRAYIERMDKREAVQRGLQVLKVV